MRDRTSKDLNGALAGYFGFGNAGDELILAAALERVNARWTVLSQTPQKTAVASVSRWDFPALAAVFRRSRGLLLGGGELFQARTSARSLLYYAALIFWARLWGARVWGFGLGVDAALPAWGRWLVRRALSGAAGLWTREEEAFRLLSDVAPTRRAPDPVWSFDIPRAALAGRIQRVLWILRGGGPPDLAGRLADALRALPDKTHAFLSFHPAADRAFLADVRARARVFHGLETWSDPRDVFAVIARYDAVVSMRFHGLLAAALVGVPVVSLAAHGKVADLARELGMPTVALDAPASDWPAALASAAATPAEQVDAYRLEARAALESLSRAFGA